MLDSENIENKDVFTLFQYENILLDNENIENKNVFMPLYVKTCKRKQPDIKWKQWKQWKHTSVKSDYWIWLCKFLSNIPCLKCNTDQYTLNSSPRSDWQQFHYFLSCNRDCCSIKSIFAAIFRIYLCVILSQKWPIY